MPHIALLNGQAAFQPIDADILLRGAASLRPQLDARDRAGRIARAEKHTERAAAAPRSATRARGGSVRKSASSRESAPSGTSPSGMRSRSPFHRSCSMVAPHHELRITNY